MATFAPPVKKATRARHSESPWTTVRAKAKTPWTKGAAAAGFELLKQGITEEQVGDIATGLSEAATLLGEDVPPFLP
jgi:hypothetical protein